MSINAAEAKKISVEALNKKNKTKKDEEEEWKANKAAIISKLDSDKAKALYDGIMDEIKKSAGYGNRDIVYDVDLLHSLHATVEKIEEYKITTQDFLLVVKPILDGLKEKGFSVTSFSLEKHEAAPKSEFDMSLDHDHYYLRFCVKW